ncbi:URC4/urg3 family protein [Nordella sp. HKS 07]|uniref:DUF1688 family protein n=1 Tax=Nordella sp. HKS 07 TaxID=2712222 RepID=UPI0013E147E7|nr:DUF1688 family protein [Nordella sp. HKS 07]QIG49801.1 URC4/urg3 family protein [Nordella sp. HKS 07]
MTDASPLLTPIAVREAAEHMLTDGLSDKLHHWSVDLDQLPKVARFVAQVTRGNYPSLRVPFHSRWRHFEAGGIARWQKAQTQRNWPTKEAQARAALDLAIVSVLLDAGSGGRWHYAEPGTDKRFASSEGLGVASFHLMASGVLSNDRSDPWRADAERLMRFTKADLERAFQVSPDNPLAGVDGRVALLNRLGEACYAQASHFAISDAPRPGGLADSLAGEATAGRIEAAQILRRLLDTLGTIWPSRLTIGTTPLGDTWLYERWRTTGDPLSGLVPFHKLSQWITYSLIEPLIARGLEIDAMDGLTGLAEYRNGGLFIDMDVLRLKDKAAAAKPHEVNSPLIVEWRALTIALLDRLLEPVRQELGVSADHFPIASMLEGGTWAAGRRIAREKRADGSPPLNIVSDGTTF